VRTFNTPKIPRVGDQVHVRVDTQILRALVFCVHTPDEIDAVAFRDNRDYSVVRVIYHAVYDLELTADPSWRWIDPPAPLPVITP
jgi:hypothetical protein